MKSVWNENANIKSFTTLDKDISTDTVIIGGGMAGILTAFLLKEKGINNIILEADRICSGQTKNTTAKITAQHGEIYNKIEKYYGITASKQYANANISAISNYKRIIEELKIQCDYEEKDSYLYSVYQENNLKNELNAARKAGIDCVLKSYINLPFKTTGALVFKNQAQFNPLKFVSAIVPNLIIYEHSPVIRIKDNIVYTDKAKVKAKHIVVATHYPFINLPSMYFLRLSSERSYVLGLERGGSELDGMYIGIENNTLSLRTYKDLILLGGSAHRTGVAPDNNCFSSLYNRTKAIYPDHNVLYRFSAQDCISLDGLPYIGRFGGKSNNIYVATGFNKWGMTTSMVSAEIISDMICEKENSNADIFSPRRFSISACSSNIGTNTIETIKGFSSHLKPIKTNDYRNIPKNSAKEIMFNGKKAGAYKDDDSRVYIVKLVCPHLKCKLNWNQSTKTWDCPCHGSRYSYKGELIDNPAQESSILIAIK